LEGLECLSNLCVDPNWTPPVPGEEGGPSAEEGGSDGSIDNVAACDAMLDDLSCGSFDLGSVVDCDIYADVGCDIADYFDCVREVFTCTDGVADASGLPECAELVTCG